MKSRKPQIQFIYSILVYVASLAILVLFALFMANVGVNSISSENTSRVFAIDSLDLLVNFLLVVVFSFSHSFLARKEVKEFLQQYYNETLIRPIYLLVSIITLGLIVLFWTPFGPVIYDFRGSIFGSIITVAYVFGWVIEIAASFQINHFRLFGIEQTYNKLTGRTTNSDELKIPPLYRYMRHPIYTGWLMVFWITPYMTFSHLFFALGMTIYIIIATHYEERDLINYFGPAYVKYQKKVPYRYIPKIA